MGRPLATFPLRAGLTQVSGAQLPEPAPVSSNGELLAASRHRSESVASRAVAEGDGRAGERLRVETRPSSISGWRRKKSHALNLLSAIFWGPVRWPPVDIVLIDLATGRILKTWYEGGDDAAIMLSVLNEELAEMTYGEFLEKWKVAAPS